MRHWLAVLVIVAACSGDDADVAGNYTLALTNRDNGCMFENWSEGDTASGIPVVVVQDGSAVTATVGGPAGIVLDLVFGSRVYTGAVDGRDLVLTLFGMPLQQMGSCSYTFNSEIDATISGDTLTGRIEYRAATNNHPDCTAIAGCVSFQDFNGTRPPR
jgi:hypothetical protein